MRKSLLTLAAASVLGFGLVAPANAQTQIVLDPVFQRFVSPVVPTAPAWFLADNTTRSGSINLNSTYPGGQSLVIPARGSGNLIRVVNSTDGSELGTLDMTGVSGGTFIYNGLGATSTGQIYAGNLITAAGNFKVYRWANDDSATTPTAFTVAISQPRLGDGLNAYSNPSNPNEVTVVAVGNNAASPVLVMQSTDGGDTFTSKTIGITQAIGVATDGVRVFTKRPSFNIEVWDIATEAKIGEITPRSGFAGTTSGLDYYRHGSRDLLALASYAGGTQFRVHVYDITDYPISPGTAVVDWAYQVDAVGAINNANGNGTAGVSVWVENNLVKVAHVATNNLYAVYSQTPTNTVLVANDETGDYLNIQDAISSFTPTGANAAATPPFTINIKPTGTPYNERITLNDARVGLGDIVGSITLQSSVPGTRPALELQRSAGEASGTSTAGIQIYQNVHDVTLRDLLIYPSVTGELYTRHHIKIDENSANATFNTVTIDNCIITETGVDGNPLVTTRAQAYDPPSTNTAAGRTSNFTQAVQFWGDLGESMNFVMTDTVLYGPPAGGTQGGNLLRLNFNGSNGGSAYLNNNVMAYGPTNAALMRVGTGNSFASNITIEGGDQTNGLDDTNVFIHNATGNHAITFEGTHQAGASDTASTVTIQSAIIVAKGHAAARGISAGVAIWRLLDISNVIFDVNGAALVAFHVSPSTMSNVTANSNQAYFSLGGAGSLEVSDSIFTGVDTVAADGKFGGTIPTGGILVRNSAFGLDVVNQVGTGATGGTVTIDGSVIVANPIYISTDFQSPDFFDVANDGFAGVGTAGANLGGGGDFVGGTPASVDDWMLLND